MGLSSQKHARLRRYVDIFILALVAGVLAFPFGGLLALAGKMSLTALLLPPEWSDLLHTWRPYIQFALETLVVTFGLAVFLPQTGFRQVSSFRVGVWRYPPLLWAVIVGWCAFAAMYIILFVKDSHDIQYFGMGQLVWEIFLIPLGAVLSALLVRSIVLWAGKSCKKDKPDKTRGKRTSANGNGADSDSKWSDPDLPDDLQWILREEPVPKLEDDRFRRGPVVRRLATRFSDFENWPVSVGILGPYGSGKTSVTRFVESEIGKEQKSPPVYFVPIHGWAVQAGNLTNFVLTAIIRRIQEIGFDTSSLRRISRDYSEAMGNLLGGWWGLIAARFRSADSPEAVIGRLDALLESADIRLVLCVEDFERLGSLEVLQEVSSMFDRLRRATSRVSFIIEANRNAAEYFDLTRLCNHVERVPKLPWYETWTVLCRFRNACKEFAEKNGDILPTELYREKPDDTPAEDFFWDATRRRPLGSFQWNTPEWELRRRIADLAGTPRVLKHGLRRAWDAWKKLHGEVDLRELILLNVLRDAAPEAFDFLLREMEVIRGYRHAPGTSVGGDNKEEAARKYLTEQWRKVTEKADWSADAALVVLRVLDLAHWTEQPTNRMEERSTDQVPQSVRTDGTYWQRIVSGAIDDDLPRDQFVLHQIADWRERRDAKLVQSILDDDKFAAKVLQFRGALWPESKMFLLNAVGYKENERKLFEELLDELCRRHGRGKWNLEKGFPAKLEKLLETLAMEGSDTEANSTLLPWLREQFGKILDCSLAGTVHLLYALKVKEHWPIGRTGMNELGVFCLRHIIDRLETAPGEYLHSVLSPSDLAYVDTLTSLVGYFGSPLGDELVVALLHEIWKACQRDILYALPLFLSFIQIRPEKPNAPPHLFSNWADRLFPTQEERRKFLETLDAYLQHAEADETIRQTIREIRPEVEHWIEEGSPSGPNPKPNGNERKPSESPSGKGA